MKQSILSTVLVSAIFFAHSTFALQIINSSYNAVFIAITRPDLDCRIALLDDPIILNGGSTYSFNRQMSEAVCVATKPTMPFLDRLFYRVLQNNPNCTIDLGRSDVSVVGC